MNKHILIVNGYPCAGKTTFEKMIAKKYPSNIFSSIDPIKKIAKDIGWDGETKTEALRNFLSSVKKSATEFNDYPFKATSHVIEDFFNDKDLRFLMIDIREPEEIRKIVECYPFVTTIFISNKNNKTVATNNSDENVTNYIYEYYISNDGTFEDLEDAVNTFLNELETQDAGVTFDYLPNTFFI